MYCLQGLVKLADFGVAARLSELEADRDKSRLSVVGTPYWMAPEVIEMTSTTPASDIWSVACLAIELLTGQPPYFDLQPMSALFRIVQVSSGRSKKDQISSTIPSTNSYTILVTCVPYTAADRSVMICSTPSSEHPLVAAAWPRRAMFKVPGAFQVFSPSGYRHQVWVFSRLWSCCRTRGPSCRQICLRT